MFTEFTHLCNFRPVAGTRIDMAVREGEILIFRMAKLESDPSLTVRDIQRATAAAPLYVQQRLLDSFHYHFRARRPRHIGSQLLTLESVQFSDGAITYALTRRASGWHLRIGGKTRGRPGLGAREKSRIPSIYQAVLLDLKRLRKRLRRSPLPIKGISVGTARQLLRDSVGAHPLFLRYLTVTAHGTELQLAAVRGHKCLALGNTAPTWREFAEGLFPLREVTLLLVAQYFDVSTSTIARFSARSKIS